MAGNPDTDTEPEPGKDELIQRVTATADRWRSVIDRSGDRTDQAGAAGDWTLRDVIAHVNAYLRFLVENLGGESRPFGEMPDDIGLDFQKRNEWLHDDDLQLSWEAVVTEHAEIVRELVAQLGSRSQEYLLMPMVEWAPMPVWRWVLDLTELHYNEHAADLETWLGSGSPSVA